MTSSVRKLASSTWATTGAAAIGFLLLTLGFTAPQIASLDSVYPHQDPSLTIWRLAWIAHQVPRDPLHLLDTNILYPLKGTAVFSDALPLLGLMASPLIWAGVPAVVAYNVLVLGAFVTAAMGAFLLVRELTGSAAAGIVAGLAFGFTPFRFDHYWHLELLWTCWMPLTLWALHRTLATGRWTSGILTGLGIAAQTFSCIYFAIFLATWLAIIGVLLVALRLLDLRSLAFRALLVGAVLGVVLVAPYGRAYTESARVVGTRSTEETATYSAEARSYLASPVGNYAYGWTSARWGANEKHLFPGLTLIVLAAIGLWPPLNRLRIIYAIALVVAFDLSLGMNGLAFPSLRTVVPLFEGLRAPARAATLVHLGLAILAGYGIARLRARIGSVAVVAACGLMLVEYAHQPLPMQPLATKPPVLATWLAQPPQQAVVLLHMPVPRADLLPGDDWQYQYLSTFHWRNMVNGYTSFTPPRYLRLMEMMVTFPDARSLGALRQRGVTHVIVHPALYPRGEGDALATRLSVSPDFSFVGFFPDGLGTAAVFRLLDRPV
jgi:hypothetical protein